ncbi:MAG: SpoIID/LytB domain-containing protein, partial [Planctomycetota bacterium]|nr:SpoIID/LytB domain-containing protein [Planctomycetota bacterium]
MPPAPLDPAGVEIRVGILSAERILLRMPGRVEIRPLAGGEPLYRGELPGAVAAISSGAGIELAGMAFAGAVRVAPLGDRAGEAGVDFAPGAGPRPERLPALYHRVGSDFTVTAILDGSEASSYRGALELRADDGLVQAVNALDLQSYLLGVVGAEMPAYFEAEALAAQAIVSRTFALYNIERARSNAQSVVFRATTGFQVYKGFSAETRSTRTAVVETRGQALSWRGALFSSYFHSTCGGRTANATEALGVTAITPLAGV